MVLISLSLKSSYEEWKRYPKGNLHLFRVVLNLPMRDGNHSKITTVLGCALVLNLPMRNGNYVLGEIPKALKGSLKSSYEGWKQK